MKLTQAVALQRVGLWKHFSIDRLCSKDFDELLGKISPTSVTFQRVAPRLLQLHKWGFALPPTTMNALQDWMNQMTRVDPQAAVDAAVADDDRDDGRSDTELEFIEQEMQNNDNQAGEPKELPTAIKLEKVANDGLRQVNYSKQGTPQSIFNPVNKPEQSEKQAKQGEKVEDDGKQDVKDRLDVLQERLKEIQNQNKKPEPEPMSPDQPRVKKSPMQLALDAAKAIQEAMQAQQEEQQQQQQEREQQQQEQQNQQPQLNNEDLDELEARVLELEVWREQDEPMTANLVGRVEIIEANYVGSTTFNDTVQAFEDKLSQILKPTVVQVPGKPDVVFNKRTHEAFAEVLLLSQVFSQAYLVGPAGTGKCLGYNTPVMLATGEVVPVQDIKQGDLLMGPDSTPRRVVSTTTGRETMYRIIPTKGDSWECNESHILSMVVSEKNSGWTQGEIVNITVKDYLALPKSRKKTLKQYRTGVDFPEQSVPLNPYFLGLWLGDGHSHAGVITNSDPEVVEYLKEFAEESNLHYSARPDPRSNAIAHKLSGEHGRKGHYNLVTELRAINVLDNKHIPAVYLHNSRKVRLDVLAGLLDTDGYLQSNHYEICTVHPELRDNILYLCRSLGLYASSKIKLTNFENAKTAYRIHISGHLDEIPCIVKRRQAKPRKQVKNVLRTAIMLENLGEGDYYGFELQGPDRLFLLGDFTVTHNTSLAADVAKALGLDFGFISCSAGMAEAHLLGRMIANGTYLPARFVQLYENGGLFLFDEVDAADANTMLVLNSALANGYLSVPNRQDNPVAHRHPDFVCVVAANTLGTGSFEYHGRNYLDAAFLDRFATSRARVDYDVVLEREMLGGDSEMARVLHKIRFNIEESNTRRVLSSRAFISTQKLMLAGQTPQSVIDRITLGWTKDEKARALKDVVVPKSSPLIQAGIKQREAEKTKREQAAAKAKNEVTELVAA